MTKNIRKTDEDKRHDEKLEIVQKKSDVEEIGIFKYLFYSMFKPVIVGLLLGGMIGFYYIALKKSEVYLFEEKPFFTSVSVALAYDSKESGIDVTETEKEQLHEFVSKLKETLKSDYPNVIIKGKDKELRVLEGVKINNVTQEITKKVIGKEKWEKVRKVITGN